MRLRRRSEVHYARHREVCEARDREQEEYDADRHGDEIVHVPDLLAVGDRKRQTDEGEHDGHDRQPDAQSNDQPQHLGDQQTRHGGGAYRPVFSVA